MANCMQAYFLSQPQTLKSILKSEHEQIRKWAEANKNIHSIHMIGSGSSSHMARASRPLFERLAQVKVNISVPTDVPSECSFSPNEGVLLISQEGKSVNTHRIAQKLTGRHTFALLTALADSPTAQLCDHLILLGCGKENCGPKTVGVLCTFFMLAIMAIELGRIRGTIGEAERATELEELARCADMLQESISTCLNWYEPIAGLIQNAPALILISSHDSRPLADEAALKMVETLYIPCCSYEVEEFVHGPHCLLGTNALFIGLLDTGDDDKRISELCCFASEKGGRSLLVSVCPTSTEQVLSLSGSSRFPIHLLLPFQMISAWLAEEMGHSLDKPKFSGFATRFGSKLM